MRAEDKQPNLRPIKIGIIAGELSGDLLGAGLIREVKRRYPNAQFVGIGGRQMQKEGCRSLYPIERLSVMGIFEVLGRLFELLTIRRKLYRYFLKEGVDLFIGIDAPDFNLTLEEKLRQRHVKTVHYVSPSVWAWRQKRVFKIRRAVDLILTLLPFEVAFYQNHEVAVKFVGHPLANKIPLENNRLEAKRRWGYSKHEKVVAILPGSRAFEVKNLGPVFIETAIRLSAKGRDIRFIVPLASSARRKQFEKQLSESNVSLSIRLVDGHARAVMEAADVVLLASGTATLEAMLIKRPMVVAYKWGWLTHAIVSRLVTSRYVALPNLLAREALVPEFIQEEATPDHLAQAVYRRLEDQDGVNVLLEKFDEIHRTIRCDADQKAADAVVNLIEGEPSQPGNA